MYSDRDFDIEGPLPWNEEDLAQDLELNRLFKAMSGGDKFLYEVARRAVFSSVNDVATIRYRQAILADCLAHPDALHEMYAIAVEAEEGKRGYYWLTSGRYPSSTLSNAVGLLEFYVAILRRLRKTTDAYQDVFRSSGFQTLCATLKEELSDAYFDVVEAHLKRLKFKGGALISGRLGAGKRASSTSCGCRITPTVIGLNAFSNPDRMRIPTNSIRVMTPALGRFRRSGIKASIMWPMPRHNPLTIS